MSKDKVFNCFLVGNKSSGRTSFLSHHIPRDHSRNNGRISGEGVMMYPLIINTSVGTIQFNIWDIDGMQGKCLVPTDCAIIFESVTNDIALKTCQTWQTDLVVVIESIKLMVACSNEPFNSFGDLNVEWMQKTSNKSMKLDYYNLLTPESPQNVEKIFLWLSRKLLNDKNIDFFSYPVFLPRFFIRAQKSDQGFCCHCFCVMVKNPEQESSTSSSSSSESSYLEEESTDRKGGGDSKSINKQSRKNKSNEELDKKNEEKSFVHKNKVADIQE